MIYRCHRVAEKNFLWSLTWEKKREARNMCECPVTPNYVIWGTTINVMILNMQLKQFMFEDIPLSDQKKFPPKPL